MKKMIMSIGTAIAASRLAQMASGVRFDDVLGTVGLARRRSNVVDSLLFLGAGIAVGAGAALLLAPTSGREARARIGKEVSRLTEAAGDAMRETTESARALMHNSEEGPKNSKRATT